MSWQARLDEAARAYERRRGEMVPWWVTLDEPTDTFWATTRESGDGWTLAVVARVIYSNRVPTSVERTSDPDVALVRAAHPMEHIAVDEGDMGAFVASLRRYGRHGTYRKSGTSKEYRF